MPAPSTPPTKQKTELGDWKATERPNAKIVPGKMRSDREQIPDGYTKADADKAETMEAAMASRNAQLRVSDGCQVYWPAPYEVCGAIRDKYNSLGGPNGFLLHPKTNELTNPDGRGKRTEFVNGPIYWSLEGGAHPVVNHFLAAWARHGYEGGYIGYPTTDEIVNPDKIGRRQHFTGATIYWKLNEGYSIGGAIFDRWGQTGWEQGYLGYPTSDETGTPDGAGRFNRFERGMIYWSPATGAHAVSGRIFDVWAGSGYEGSRYGYPTGEATPVSGQSGAVSQQFEHGNIYVRGEYVRAQQVADGGFASYDTGLHPGYPAVDLSKYNTIPDPDGTATQANLQKAAGVLAYFKAKDRLKSADLWDHYYKNTGTDYVLDSKIVDAWTAEAKTDYAGVKPPAPLVEANKEDAIRQAITEADRTGQPAKIIVSTPWQVTGGNSNDQVQALGRYSLCSTTAVIAQPGGVGPGTHRIELRQQTHVYDVYNFAAGDKYGDLAQAAVQTGVDGEKLGQAKPFLDYGSGSEKSWSGTR
ncbi:LGFP repeat-containing protein [Nocardia sp. CA-128927]|uniref:LGFP repeat-containing protein n=1 Tax=Nocardia sp. CA-128927 TaxID=3239975 RepID=UPI003D957CA1